VDRSIHTFGHSNRSADELIALLQSAEVEAVVDVRRFPASRRHPWFDRTTIEHTLYSRGIRYEWLGESLGGRIDSGLPVEQSRNGALQEPAFRWYADSMQTRGFRGGLAELEALAAEHRVAVMCAERDWQQCHRQILADLLLVRGWDVLHLFDPDAGVQSHALNPWARRVEGELYYPSLV